MTGPGRFGGGTEPPRSSKPAPSGGQFAGAGLQLALTIVVFMFLGIWLDKTLGTSPWLVILCVFLGAGAGFYSMYRRLMREGQGGGGAGKKGASGP